MRRTLEGISRRQEANDETIRASETRMQELQPMPKRLDDMGFELNNHYNLAEDKIRRQEAELRALADKLVRSDEERLHLARKVEQLSTDVSLQATQAGSRDLGSTQVATNRTKRKEEDVLSTSESDEQPVSSVVVSNGLSTTSNPLPKRPPKKLKAEHPKHHKRRITSFQRYVQTSKHSYRRAPPKNGSDMKRFINRFIEGIEEKSVSSKLQKQLLQRFQSVVREARSKKGPRSIVIEGNLHWDDVCQLLDSASLLEDKDEDNLKDL
ncbi:uncharacterized protein ColSpa_02477 [Colletotrichum spaethianum]|uniref:Uncharacterized protein n=1 Tax=Colletotrichum spaethianum TaxID=700344 RepID=A0AA37L5B7_9PEZI|nr:uncharacterized protein ColSpa_02477 [Colletotrichum spaethianum]GKT42296.1 hypothetical protein ColSpa_02477 [Colletotrichum spaethianum]